MKSVKLACLLLALAGPVLSQEGSVPSASVQEALEGDPTLWLKRLDEGSAATKRLLSLSPAEFTSAVESLEKSHDGSASMRLVWLVAINQKRLRLHHNLDELLSARAAAALVKATEVEDKKVLLQNLANITGVDHPAIREMLRRLSGSDNSFISELAQRNLKTLEELARMDANDPGNAPKRPAPLDRQAVARELAALMKPAATAEIPITPAPAAEPGRATPPAVLPVAQATSRGSGLLLFFASCMVLLALGFFAGRFAGKRA